MPLTPKVFDTLLVLIENSNHVLTKKELMQQVWPDSFVEENNLAQNISILRKALGESKESEHYIQTVPKRGYRFVGDVRATGGDEETMIVRERNRARIVVESTDEDEAAPLISAPHVRNVLPSIRIPSLVIHRTDDQCLKVEEGRFVAEKIPGAKFVEFPGNDLVAGSGISFEDRGTHMLSGCGEWRLFAVQR